MLNSVLGVIIYYPKLFCLCVVIVIHLTGGLISVSSQSISNVCTKIEIKKTKIKRIQIKGNLPPHHIVSDIAKQSCLAFGFFLSPIFCSPPFRPEKDASDCVSIKKNGTARKKKKRNETKANKPFHPQRDQKSTALWRACGRICILTIPPLLSFYIYQTCFCFVFWYRVGFFFFLYSC